MRECSKRQIKSIEVKSGYFEVLPGRWLETTHTHQYDEDLRPAGEKEKCCGYLSMFVFVIV